MFTVVSQTPKPNFNIILPSTSGSPTKFCSARFLILNEVYQNSCDGEGFLEEAVLVNFKALSQQLP